MAFSTSVEYTFSPPVTIMSSRRSTRYDRGAAVLPTSLVRRVAAELDAYDGAERAQIGTAMIDLLSAVLAGWSGAPRTCWIRAWRTGR